MGYEPGQPPSQPDQPDHQQRGYQAQPPQQPGYQPPYQQPGPGYQPPYQQPGPGYQQPYQQPGPGYQQPYQPGFQEGKDWLTALLLCIFVGALGIHRFYAGKMGTGIVMLLTGGGCGVWWLIDIILIANGSFKDSNGMPLIRR